MRTDDGRERILAAGERCIDRHGIHKTTMDDIASEVGLSGPSVYRYFADRDDLLIELISRHARRLLDRAYKAISRRSEPLVPLSGPVASSMPSPALHGLVRPRTIAGTFRYHGEEVAMEAKQRLARCD